MTIKQINNSRSLHWEAILFFCLYIVSPSYFAFDLKGSFPLITCSRLLLVVLGICTLLRRTDVFSSRSFCFSRLNLFLTPDKPLLICFLGYFILMLLVNFTFVTKTPEAIKQIFVIVLEEYSLVWILTMILNTRAKVREALKLLVLTSGVLGLLGGISVILDYNVFQLLDTANRPELVVRPFYRYGLLRAVCGFHHAVYYGAYCAVSIPLAMYFVEDSPKKQERYLYSLCIALNLVGLLFSNSRGSQLAFVCLAGLIFLIRLLQKSLLNFFRTYIPAIVVAVLLSAVIFFAAPAGRQVISNLLYDISSKSTISIQAVTNINPAPQSVAKPVLQTTAKPVVQTTTKPALHATLLSEATSGVQTTAPTQTNPTGQSTVPAETKPVPQTTAPTVPTETVPAPPNKDLSFGENPNGLLSRFIQLSGITYTLEREPLFGLGPNAHMEGKVAYMYAPGKWAHLTTVDVNVVSIVCQYGLIGLAAFLFLYMGIGFLILRRPYCGDPLMRYLMLSFISYMLCLLSISSLDKWFWVFIGITLALVNVIRKEQTK